MLVCVRSLCALAHLTICSHNVCATGVAKANSWQLCQFYWTQVQLRPANHTPGLRDVAFGPKKCRDPLRLLHFPMPWPLPQNEQSQILSSYHFEALPCQKGSQLWALVKQEHAKNAEKTHALGSRRHSPRHFAASGAARRPSAALVEPDVSIGYPQ